MYIYTYIYVLLILIFSKCIQHIYISCFVLQVYIDTFTFYSTMSSLFLSICIYIISILSQYISIATMENHVFFSNQVWQGCRVLLELRGYHHQLKQQTLWCFREIYWQPPFFWKITQNSFRFLGTWWVLLGGFFEITPCHKVTVDFTRA